MKDFDVYEEVEMRDDGDNYYADTLPTMWAKRPKGAEVRCRFVCKGCDQETIDKGDTCASTPLLCSLKLFLVVGLHNNYRFNLYDVCRAFLHAELREEVFV